MAKRTRVEERAAMEGGEGGRGEERRWWMKRRHERTASPERARSRMQRSAARKLMERMEVWGEGLFKNFDIIFKRSLSNGIFLFSACG